MHNTYNDDKSAISSNWLEGDRTGPTGPYIHLVWFTMASPTHKWPRSPPVALVRYFTTKAWRNQQTLIYSVCENSRVWRYPVQCNRQQWANALDQLVGEELVVGSQQAVRTLNLVVSGNSADSITIDLNESSIILHWKFLQWWWSISSPPDPSTSTSSVLLSYQPAKIEFERHRSRHLLYHWRTTSYKSDPRCPHNTPKTPYCKSESLSVLYVAILTMLGLGWVLRALVGTTQEET